MNLLEFANPTGFWWLMLGIPIVVFYILKVRLRRQQVSTLLFWDRVFNEKKPRSWWQQLRHLLSLLLQLAFLTLVIAALVDPLWSWQKKQQRRIALVIDNSASMSAEEESGESRFAQAKHAARSLVRSLREGDRMAILSAGGKSRVEIGMTGHQRSLLEAIDRLSITDGPTLVSQAVAIGQRLLMDEKASSEVVVITDGCFEITALSETQVGSETAGDQANGHRLNEEVKSDSKRATIVYGVGDHRDNVGITRFQVRRSLVDSVGYQVMVDVTNFSDQSTRCRIEFALGDDLIDVVPLELTANETKTRILDHTSTTGGVLKASLDVQDALAADNHAIAILPVRHPIPVTLVTEGNLFLTSVLESIPLVELTVVTEAPTSVPNGEILVLDQIVPTQLPKGNLLVVDPQSNCDSWTIGEMISEPIVAWVDAESPITQHVRLDNVLFPKARELAFTIDTQPLIRDPLDRPLLTRMRRRNGDVVVLTCSLAEGDLPLRIAFPVLMKNAVEWFQGDMGELRTAVASGQMTSVSIPTRMTSGHDDASGRTDLRERAEPVNEVDAGTDADNADITRVESDWANAAAMLELVSPNGEVLPASVTNQQVTIGPLVETGVWSIRPEQANAGTSTSGASSGENSNQGASAGASSDEKSRSVEQIMIACNLTNRDESDLRSRAEMRDVHDLDALALGGHSLWLYLALAALLLTVTEWWLYQRRIVG